METMGISRNSCLMMGAIGALSIICIGLIIGLVNTKHNIHGLGQDPNPPLSIFEPKDVIDYPEPESEPEVNEVNKIGPNDGPPWETNIRLPRTVLPIHYDLYLYPKLQDGTFEGKVSILVNALEPRDHFLVHVKHLDLEEVRLAGEDGQEIRTMAIIEHKNHEFLVVRPEKEVPMGNYTISIKYGGSLTNGIVGFYKSVYTNSRGDQIPIATSKFQPTYARKAFPCFDEPSFKSSFTVTLVRPSNNGYIGLSNMPVEREIPNSPEPGLTEVKFQKSFPMVTYLACFIVCDFEYQEKYTAIHKTPLRVYATAQNGERIRYALEIGANITDFFEDYFEVKYPLPKQDMIAIPDFVSGAMEHWGLITYRETSLLYDEYDSSSFNKQRVATVVSHELAHQWFGNLVTLSWWDDLWLNEGFASYIEYKGVANYHSDWEMLEQFLTLDLHRVMNLDATLNSHPIIEAVHNPDQITELFDSITYSKGASVLRMLEDFMGAEEFRIGIKRFLERYKYGNAITKDLWRELELVSSQRLNVSHIMDTWTRQMGLPVVTVTRIKENVVRIHQQRFLRDPSRIGQGKPSPYHYKWDIYLSYITSVEPKTVKAKWFSTEDEYVDVTLPGGTDWVKFNIDQKGYYRVNYPRDQWDVFSKILKTDHKTLGTADRTSLINDAFALAASGYLEYSVPLSILSYLKEETNFVPWSAAYSELKTIESYVKSSDIYEGYREFVLSLVSSHYQKLGWNDEGSHVDKKQRINILHLACENGHEQCLKEAGEKFKAWIQNENVFIPPNLRTLTYKYGMISEGNKKNWDIMFERYLKEQNAQEKRKLMNGLAWIQKPWILKLYMDLARNESVIRSQDYTICLSYISSNPIGNPLVWDFIRDEWEYLVDRFTLNDRYLGRLPKTVSRSFSTSLKLEEMKSFFAKYPDAGAGARARKQAKETVENNIKWLKDNKETVSKWLEQQMSLQ